ncbi:hypothetical protein HGRIS_014232 [Hohenbuehelia grisea]|uniref:Uncharacterized protein n=1 Tax=Hohenbuehelia grisea TaxID=104357 RepID=A0ABR3JUQ6_9AGAR
MQNTSPSWTARGNVCIGGGDFDREDYADIANLWAIPLMWRSKIENPASRPQSALDPDWSNYFLELEGLLLAPAGAPDEHKYRRVGRWAASAAVPTEPSTMPFPTWIDEVPVMSVILV